MRTTIAIEVQGLQKLQQLNAEMTSFERNCVSAKEAAASMTGAFAPLNRSLGATSSAALKASDRLVVLNKEFATLKTQGEAGVGVFVRVGQAAERASVQQSTYNRALAAARVELEAMQRGPYQKLQDMLSGNKMPALRAKFVGVSDDDLRKLQAAQLSMDKISAKRELMNSAGNGFMNLSAGVTAIGLESAKMAAQFDSNLTLIRNNTTMTDKDFALMRETVMRLGTETGASFGKIAEGFAHVTNFGYSGADAVKILEVATKAAVATNGDAAVTGQLLAKVLRENGMAASDAAKTMDVLWYSAANSDLKMADLVETGGRVFSMASKIGLSFQETAAVMSVFAGQGMKATDATTQLVNILKSVTTPTAQVQDRLKKLSAATGVDLVGDFTLAGLRTKQLSGVFDDLRIVSERVGQPFAQLAKDTFPGLKGTIGALIGTSDSGIKGLHDRLSDVADIESGKVSPMTKLFAETLKMPTNEFDRLANEIRVDFIPVGEQFLHLLHDAAPLIRMLAGNMHTLLDWFTRLPTPIQESVLAIGAFRLATLALGNPLPWLIGKLGALVATFRAVPGAAAEAEAGIAAVGAASGTAGGAGLLARIGGGGLARAALTNPVVLTAAGMLVSKDTGNGQLPIRTGPGQTQLQRQLDAAQKELTQWQGMSSDQRLDYVKQRRGTNLFGQPNTGRDEYDAELKAAVASFTKALDAVHGASPGTSAVGGRKNNADSSLYDNLINGDKEAKATAAAQRKAEAAARKAARASAKEAKEADEERQQALDDSAERAEMVYRIALRDHGAKDPGTKFAAFIAQRRALEAASTANQRFSLTNKLTGPAENFDQEQKQANEQEKSAREEFFRENVNMGGFWISRKLLEEMRRRAEARDEKANSYASGVLQGADAKIRALDLQARPNSPYYNADEADKSKLDQQKVIVQGAITALEAMKVTTPETTRELAEMRERLAVVNHALVDLDDRIKATALTKAIAGIQNYGQDAIKQRDLAEMPVPTSMQPAAREQYLRDIVDITAETMSELGILSFAVNGAGGTAEALQKAVDDNATARANLRRNHMQTEIDRADQQQSKYQNLRDQVKGTVNGAASDFLHGKGDIGTFAATIGKQIADAALMQQIQRYTDPLINVVTNEIAALEDLRKAVEDNTTAQGGGGNGSGGGGGGGGGSAGGGNAKGKFGWQQAAGAALGAYGIFANGQQQGLSLGGVLGGVMSGAQIGSMIPGVGSLIGGIAGGALDLLGGLFGHRKTVDPVKSFNPALTNGPSDMDYWAYRYRATGQLPTQAEASGYKPPTVVNNIYVDGVKKAVNTAIAQQTSSATTTRSSSFYDMKRPIA